MKNKSFLNNGVNKKIVATIIDELQAFKIGH